MDDLEHEVGLLSAGELGELHVACGPTVADGLVGMALGRLHKAHPGVKIAVQVGPHHELPGLLRSRKVDLIVVEISLIEHDAELEIEVLPEQEIVIYARADHPLAGKEQVKPQDLFRYPAVGTHLPPWAETWLKKHQPTDGSYPGLQLQCSHHGLLKQVVLASNAISGAPREVLRTELECGALAVIDLAADKMHNRAGVVWLRGRSLSPAALRLVEELKRMDVSQLSPTLDPPLSQTFY
jgi:DNA-binding transcriptional LysR family regulator